MSNESPAGGMTDTVSTPIPCRWCGDADVHTYHNAVCIRTTCANCGAAGPRGNSMDEAIRLWNTRSPDIAAKVRTEALREAAERIKQHLANCQSNEDRRVYGSHENFAMECSGLAFKTAAELVEALIKTDSGVSIDPAQS